MENDKKLYADQDNVRWYILEKRELLQTSYSNYIGTRKRDGALKNICIECILYLCSHFIFLKSIQEIKENKEEFIISYTQAKELYFGLIVYNNSWSEMDLFDMYNFVLIATIESGVGDSGFKIINTNIKGSKIARILNNKSGDDDE
jgi:hypothetical protein